MLPGMPSRHLLVRFLAALAALALALAGTIVLAGTASAAGRTWSVPVGSSPTRLALSPDGTRLYVANSGSNSVSVIDTAHRAVIATIGVGAGPQGIAVSPDGTKVIVANRLDGTYSFIDTSTLAVYHTVPTIGSTCDEPQAVAFHPDGSTAYVGCGADQRLDSINTTTYAIGIVSAGSVPAKAIAVSSSANEVIYIGGFAGIYVNSGWAPGINPEPVAVATTSNAAVSYTPHDNGTMSKLTQAGGTVTNFPVGSSLTDVSLNAAGTHAYVSDKGTNEVLEVDLATHGRLASFPTGNGPRAIAVDSSESFAYTANAGDNTVSIIDMRAQASGDNVPTAPLQQFARAESDACDVQPDTLIDFPGLADLANVSWGRSWAQWPNGGTGGFVCTRQPYYTTAGSWAVR